MLDPQAVKLESLVRLVLAGDLVEGKLVDRERIASTVDRYAALAAPGLPVADRESVIGSLEQSFNVWSGRAGALISKDPSFRIWLPARRSEIKWKFWNRYRLFIGSRFPPRSLEELDSVSDDVLGYLEDPTRTGSWRRHGLVVGHVQSGKTANYTGLICKAADAGYKVVVVLAGIHNSLRSQTQIRLDEGFLGYARPFGKGPDHGAPVGVGLIDPSAIADTVTTRDERGDFSAVKAQGFQVHAGGNVLLFVVKKNASVLKNLLRWAELNAKTTLTSGQKVVSGVPLLMIDDEADQASIDTNYQVFDENGVPDPEHDPKPINRHIRSILQRFERAAYVGYTATPFANVLVHHRGETDEFGPDLFPKHFIVNLGTPSDYFGPSRVFGTAEADLPAQGKVPSRVRFTDDASEWVPASHKGTHVPRYSGDDPIPPSLDEAIKAFILVAAGRRARGEERVHNSMLVHVTRFTDVQRLVHRQVQGRVDELRRRWRTRQTTLGDEIERELNDMWNLDFRPTATEHQGNLPEWALVSPHVWPVIDSIRINLINAKASDALVYQEHEDQGLCVIAIGGDKLSRGLTLEGLSVSYFLRASRMYDTLMQMGRWFGYRPGYEDLCRLYLSQELAEWYGHIAEASEELRAEFDRMVIENGTPDDYGFRVRTHPVLAITGKLRPGLREITTSLSATPFEPTILREDALAKNWELSKELTEAIQSKPTIGWETKDDGVSERRRKWPGSVVWSSVDAGTILQFLDQFSFADRDLTRTPSTVVRQYIRQRVERGELTNWTVALLGKLSDDGKDPSVPFDLPKLEVTLQTLYRKPHGTPRRDRYVVKRVGSPKDEALDLTTAEWKQVVGKRAQMRISAGDDKEYRLGRLIRQARPPTRGLLILYALTPSEPVRTTVGALPLIAPYLSFPYSGSADPITYKLSELYWEQELSGAE